MEQLRCVVERITYQNPENGYTVIKCRAKGFQDLIAVVGAMPDVHVGSVLSLGSAVKFGADGTLDQWEAGEDATNHAFMVIGGDVRIRHADALNGLNVTVSNTASAFRLPFSSGDADLKAYGIRNVKTDTPFALPAGADKLPLTILTNGMAVASNTVNVSSLAFAVPQGPNPPTAADTNLSITSGSFSGSTDFNSFLISLRDKLI